MLVRGYPGKRQMVAGRGMMQHAIQVHMSNSNQLKGQVTAANRQAR